MLYDIVLWKSAKLQKGNTATNQKFFPYKEVQIPNQDLIINDDDTINILTKKILVNFNLTKNVYLWCEFTSKEEYIIYDFVNNVFKLNDKVDFLYFKKCVENYFKNATVNSDNESIYISKNDAFNFIKKINMKEYIINIPLQFRYSINSFFEPLNYHPNYFDLQNNDFKGYNPNNQLFNTIEYILNYPDNSKKIKINVLDETEIKSSLINEFCFPLKQNMNKDVKDLIEKIKSIESLVYNYKLTNKFNERTYINFFHCKFKCSLINYNFKEKNILFYLFNNIKTSNIIPFIKYKTNADIYYKIDKNNLELKELSRWSIYTFNKNNTKFINFKIKPNIDNERYYYNVSIYEDLTVDVKVNTNVDEKNNINKINEFLNKLGNILNIKIVSFLNIIEINTYNYLEIINNTPNFNNIDKIINNVFFPYFNIISMKDNTLHLQYKKVNNYNKYDNISAFLNANFTMSKDDLIEIIISKFLITKDEAKQEYEKWANKTNLEIKVDNKKIKVKVRNDNNIDIIIKLDNNNSIKYNTKGLKTYKTQERIENLIKIIIDYNNLNKKNIISPTKSDNFDDILYNSSDKNSLSISDFENNSIFMDDEEDLDLLELQNKFKNANSEDEAGPSNKEENTVSDRKIFKQSKILESLKDADRDLFSYEKSIEKKRKDYPSSCQWVSRRMPVVITKKEKDKIDSEFPNSYANFKKTGTTQDLANKNFYICPAIWCPISKVSITNEQYLKYGKKCPYPEINETPVLFDKNYWGENSLDRPRYVGYLNQSSHPKKFCLPCCFKKNQDTKIEKTACIDNFNNEKKEESIGKNKPSVINKYVKNEFNFPLNPGDRGLIPRNLNTFMDNNKFVRTGIEHQTHSFISCFLFLTSQNITVNKFLHNIQDKIPVETYISIENGKLLRSFINEDIHMNNKDNYNNFSKWFKTQKQFIKKFNLDENKLILTAFIIYNSYKNFMKVLLDDNVIKNHVLMLDLFNNENTIINHDKIQFIIFEVDFVNNNVILLCPPNRLNKNKNQLYSFIIKSLNYYEPIVSINGDKSIKKYFTYDEVSNIIDIYYNNCTDRINDKFNHENILLKLNTLGYELKHYVLGYDYKIKGYLLTNNLYIPLKNKYDLFDIYNKSFIYYNKLLDHKCNLSLKDVYKIFKNLQEIDNFYTFKAKYDAKDGSLKAIVLINDTIIPFNLSESDNFYYTSFKKDLEIFINKKIEDKRVSFINNVISNIKDFNKLLKTITLHIENSERIKKEINFILNPYNPFPTKFKRKKIFDILKNINIDVKEDVVPKLIEQILLNGTQVEDGKFKIHENEILLNQYEINSGKLKDIIELQKNPYKIITSNINEISDSIIFNKFNGIDYNDSVSSFYQNKELTSLPIKYIKLLLDFNVVDNKLAYNNSFIYNFFIHLTNINIDEVKKIIKNNIVKDYENDGLIELYNNPNFMHLVGKEDISLIKCLNVIDNQLYFPSIYEIKILAFLTKINVVIIGRKTKANPDSIQVFNNKSEYTVILNHSYDRIRKIDIYELLIKDGNKVIFNSTDIPDKFKFIINNKSKIFFLKLKNEYNTND